MNTRDIWVLYIRELRSALRERTIVVNGILIPILLYPALIWFMYTAFTFVSGQNDELTSRVMIKDLPDLHKGLRDEIASDRSLELVTSANPMKDIHDGALDVLVEFLPATGEAVELEGNFLTRLTFDESRDQSSQSRDRINEKIETYRDRFIEDAAVSAGIAREHFQNYRVEEKNVSTARQMGQFILGLLLPMLLIVMLAVGSFYPAVDSTAGERENSTWETIMTAATGRVNIVVAKYLYVATMSFVAALLNLAAMLFSMRGIISPPGGARAADMTFFIPLGAVPVILLGAALLALFIGAVMMILASFARTFKEGQSLVSPFYIALIVPVSFLQNPGQELTAGLALVPIVNVVLMFKEAIAGIYQWRLIGLTLAVEALSVAFALRVAMAVLSHEDVIVGSYSGTPGAFLRQRILRWTR
jgi:sodium transport system permease protein